MKFNVVKGYMEVILTSDSGVVKHFRVHRLVLELFVGPRPEGLEGCHGDGNRANNLLSNLRWGTPESNWEDRRRAGHHGVGGNNGNAKVSDAQRREIIARVEAGESQQAVAADYGLTQPGVSYICRHHRGL